MDIHFMPPFKKFGKKTIPFLLIAASIILSYFLLQQKNEIITLLIFVILIPIFVTVRFDGRIPLGYAILLLFIVVVLRFMKYSANPLVTISYWLLIVGTSCLVVESLREKRWKVV
jgi:hypothetical protein